MEIIILSFINLVFIALSAALAYESWLEQESRAQKIGYAAVFIHLVLGALILRVPITHDMISLYFAVLILITIILLIPTKPNSIAVQGCEGLVMGEVTRFDERDQLFARNETLHPDRPEYQTYYTELHPEFKERDDKRRAKGGDLGDPGSIDGCHGPNVSMLFGAFEMGYFLEQFAVNTPEGGVARPDIDSSRATQIIKNYARHLGADLVGVCKVDPNWIYSHKGEIHMDNWEEWGQEIKADLPYALVFATEMDYNLVMGAPHTPAIVESTKCYSKGAYISTVLARCFTHMGFRGTAQHAGHYDALLVPMAIDAGLGQLGRQGYLIADEYGCRVRLFAVLTDMPLVPDSPVDFGVEEFCSACLKCAESCPSKSIPLGPKSVVKGTSRWMLNNETCHDYWGKVGTDCCICMSICPYSRPNRSIHKLAKWMIKRSSLASKALPHLDNFVYGKKWKPKNVPNWVDHKQAF